MADVLALLVEAIRQIGILIQSFMPQSASQLLDQLNIAEDERDFTFIAGGARIKQGSQIEKPTGIFPRFIDDSQEQGTA